MLILKIIGIVLLSLLGLILVLLLLVIFSPLCYRIKAHKEAESFNAAVRILWLLGLVSASMSYDGEAWLKIKAVGIPVYKLKIWPVEEPDKKPEESVEDETQDSLQSSVTGQADECLEDAYEPEGEFFDEGYEDSEMLTDEEIDREIEEILSDESEEDAFDKLPFVKKIKAFIEKIKELILKCWQKCYNIYDSVKQGIAKAKKIYKDIRYYIRVFQHPCVKPALAKIWKNGKKLLKHVKPRRLKAKIEYGSGDPASTMRVYGYYCMIYPFYGKHIKFTPDMENKVLNFDGKLSGHVQLIRLMLMGWSLFADRNFRRLIRLLRREVKKRGRK